MLAPKQRLLTRMKEWNAVDHVSFPSSEKLMLPKTADEIDINARNGTFVYISAKFSMITRLSF